MKVWYLLFGLFHLVLCVDGDVAISTVKPISTTRSDRAIVAVQVDKNGASYIIHPEFSSNADALFIAAIKSNRTSYFYNVTGMEPEERKPTQEGAYAESASKNPPSKLFLEALLHEINSEKPSEAAIPSAEAITVEDVTHQVFSQATNKMNRLSSKAPSASTVKTTSTTMTHSKISNSDKSWRIDNSSLRAIDQPSESEQMLDYSYTYEDYDDMEDEVHTTVSSSTTTKQNKNKSGEEVVLVQSGYAKVGTPTTTKTTITVTTASTTTTTTTTVPTTMTSSSTVAPTVTTLATSLSSDKVKVTEKTVSETLKTSESHSPPTTKPAQTPTVLSDRWNPILETVTIPGTVSETVAPLRQGPGIQYIPLNSNASGLLVLAKPNETAPANLPEFVVKFGGAQPTTSSPSTSKPAFDIGSFLVQVGEVTSELLAPSSSNISNTNDRHNIPSLLDGSILGGLFNFNKNKPETKTFEPIRPQAADEPAMHHPPPRRGSVQNLNRPGLFSAFARPVRPPVRNGGHPGLGRRPPPLPLDRRHPLFNRKILPKDESVEHHTRPGLEHVFPVNRPVLKNGVLYPNSPVLRVTEHPQETDIITAPNLWNMIVSSSLTGKTDDKVGPHHRQPHFGYVVDGAESPEIVTGSPDNTFLQLMNSPSRLGLALEETVENPQKMYNHSSSSSSSSSLGHLGGNKKQTDGQSVTVRPDAMQPFHITDAVSSESDTGSEQYSYEYYDYEDKSDKFNASQMTGNSGPFVEGTVIKVPIQGTRSKPPFPYGVNLGDISESDEVAPPNEENTKDEGEHDYEGFGAAFPELISNSIRRTGLAASGGGGGGTPPPDPLDGKPEIVIPDQAIDSFDKKYNMVPVEVEVIVNQTSNGDEDSSKKATLSGESLTYLLIGTLGGLCLLILCAIGLTIRCRHRRFRFHTFQALLGRSSRSNGHASSRDSIESGQGTNVSRRLANQLQSKNGAEVATHKLGSWFTGRHTLSSLQGSTSKKPRGEMALPTSVTLGNTAGKKVTRAYFTDGRTGSTRDLVTCNSDSSQPATPELGQRDRTAEDEEMVVSPDRRSWLHTSYKDRGNSISDVRDVPYYVVSDDTSDGERPRSASATVRSPSHFRDGHRNETDDDRVKGDDFNEDHPPELPPKRRTHSNVLLQVDPNSLVDPMGSHLTLETEMSSHVETASNTRYGSNDVYWTSIDERLI